MSKHSPSSLHAHLGFWLRLVSNHVSHAFEAKVEAHGVTVAEWVLLRTMFDLEPANPSQIARVLGMTRGAISKLADRLVAKRLAQCTIDPDDRRYQSLELTPAGRRLVPTLAALADQNDAECFTSLDEQQKAQLWAILKQFVASRGLREVPTQ